MKCASMTWPLTLLSDMDELLGGYPHNAGRQEDAALVDHTVKEGII